MAREYPHARATIRSLVNAKEYAVPRLASFWCLALIGSAVLYGCRDDAPPPVRVPVPAASNRDAAREQDYIKPLPPEDWRRDRSDGRPVPASVPAPEPQRER